MKKFICTVCGYVYEGDEAPEFCPQCKQPRSKFKEVVESDELDFVTEHHIGDGVVEDAEVMEGLKAHFMGECTEVGMYLAMSRQADREGYPEVAKPLNVMLGKRLNMHLSLQNFWEKSLGIQRKI